MHGSHCYARGSYSPATGSLRAALPLIRAVRWLGCVAAIALCGNVSAVPLAYPTTATPFVSPSLSAAAAGTSTKSSTAPSADLAQPNFLAQAASSAGSGDSVNVPGLSQPQFLITDHAASSSTPTDWRAKKGDSTQDRDAQSDTQSGWSLLWRQATGGKSSNASKPSAAGVAASPDRTTARGTGSSDYTSGLKLQLLPEVPRRQAPPQASTTTALNQPDMGSVWTELTPPKPRSNAPKQQKQSPPPQDSYDSLVGQLGLPGQTEASSATVRSAATASVDVSRSPSARMQSAHPADPSSNTPPANSGFAGLMSQLAGESNTQQTSDSKRANDSWRQSTQSAGASAQRGNGVQPAANWSAANQAPQATQSQPTGFWSALSRPFTMQSDEAPIRRSASSQTAGAAKAAAHSDEDTPESEHVPQLLMPFYQVNGSPQADRNESPLAKARSNHHGPDLEKSVRASKLTRQLAMTNDDDLRAKPGDATDVALRGEHDAWDSGWTRRSPSDLNPFTMTVNPDRPVNFASQTMTIAYLQEAIPTPAEPVEPDKINLPSDENSNQGDQADNGENTGGENQKEGGGDNKKDEKLATADKLGTKPEDRSLDFLRTETVLLKPGKYQFDIGVQYTIQERNFPILFRTIDPTNPVDDAHVLTTGGKTLSFSVEEARFKSRELEVPLQLRYGLFKRVQVFIGAPVGWSNTEVDLNGRDEFKNGGGLGDINFGATVQLQDGQADCPYVIGTGVVTAPSGGDPFTNAALFSPSAPSLGNGFWKLGGNLLLIQPMDPVTFFYGAGIRGSFEQDYIGAAFEPGLEYNYTFGLGFAINEKVTLSSQLFGEYQSRLKVNGQGLDGSTQEPISLQLAATIARPCDRLVEPFVQFGLTQDAVTANIGITWTY